MSSILSVGIDIGTSTTQVIFSRITMDNMAGYFSAPRIAITGKELIYKSKIHFTPLKTPVLLDGDGVRDIVAAEFAQAGFRPEDVDTGAVIITGESARKENAAVVLEKLSSFAGEFVVSTAGPDLESVIAGKGSGAFQYSIDNDCTVVNLDIGGGTTNLAFFTCGETVGKSCFDIGGRLIRLGRDYTVEAVSSSARLIADSVGAALRPGERTAEADLLRVTDRMADLLAQAAGLAPEDPLLDRVRTPNSARAERLPRIGGVCFSGGVADCVRMPEQEDPLRFGDIGVLLGRSIRNNRWFSAAKRIDASETIRATVVGAGTYTTSLSGSTITYSQGVFPVKNLPVLKLTRREQAACLAGDDETLRRRVEWFLEQSDSPRLLLAMEGPEDPGYGELKTLAGCVVRVLDGLLPAGEPIMVAVEQDIAKALGAAMKNAAEGRRKIVSIDRVKVEAGDFIDIGSPLMDGLVVPVVVKTLLFG